VADKPKKAPRWAWLLVIPVGAAVVGYILFKQWFDKRRALHDKGTISSTVRLDDGTMVAVESVVITDRHKDPTTDQRVETEETFWRLRSWNPQNNQVLARKLIDNMAECVAAKAARLWCRWDDTVRLLDAKLEVRGEVHKARAERLQVDTEGRLITMGADGTPQRIDPVTMQVSGGAAAAKAAPTRGGGGLSPMIQVGGALYELSVKPGQLRAILHRVKGSRSKYLNPQQSFLADGFLTDDGGKPGAGLALADGFFLVHHDNVDADTPRKLSRLNLDGKVIWTAPVPELVRQGALEKDGVVVTGERWSVKLALKDGNKLWQNEH